MPDIHPPRQTGFSLIEVLVSLIVISLGILGVTGMLIKGINNAKTANMRTLAAMQAGSLASAMYANRSFWALGNTAVSFSSTADGKITQTNIVVPSSVNACDNVKAGCGAQALAGADVRNWVESVRNALANASTQVNCTAQSAGLPAPVSCDITISWQENFVDPAHAPAIISAATSGTRSYLLHVEP